MATAHSPLASGVTATSSWEEETQECFPLSSDALVDEGELLVGSLTREAFADGGEWTCYGPGRLGRRAAEGLARDQ